MGPDDAELERSLTPIYPLPKACTSKRVRAADRARARACSTARLSTTTSHATRRADARRLSLPPLPKPCAICTRRRAMRQLRCCSRGRHPAQRRLALRGAARASAEPAALRQPDAHRACPAAARSQRRRLERVSRRLPFALTGAQQAARLDGDRRRSRLEHADDAAACRATSAAARPSSPRWRRCVAAEAAAARPRSWRRPNCSPNSTARNFERWLAPLGSQRRAVARRATAGAHARSALARSPRGGRIDVVVGTHALFQEGVEFRQLALVDRRRAAPLRRAAAAAAASRRASATARCRTSSS